MSFDLRTERLNRGLSQSALARETGIDRGTVIRMERGQRPLPDTALKVADFFGVRVTDIWPVDDEPVGQVA